MMFVPWRDVAAKIATIVAAWLDFLHPRTSSNATRTDTVAPGWQTTPARMRRRRHQQRFSTRSVPRIWMRAARAIRVLTAAAALAAAGAPGAVRAQTSSSTIVLWTANVPSSNVHGNWQRASDSTAAGGAAVANPDRGSAKIAPALAAPVSYFEIAFNASSSIGYRLWVRLRAQGNSPSNDSVHVQFSDSVDGAGAPMARIGTS